MRLVIDRQVVMLYHACDGALMVIFGLLMVECSLVGLKGEDAGIVVTVVGDRTLH